MPLLRSPRFTSGAGRSSCCSRRRQSALAACDKRLKQGYPLRAFLGESPNAIKIQIWCALIADLLVKVVKDKVERATSRRWAFSNITTIIRQHLGTYVDLIGFLSDPDKALLHYRPPSQRRFQLQLAFA